MKYMHAQFRLSESVRELLCCPICRAKLKYIGEQFVCVNPDCNTNFPIVDGIPILLNEESSLFTIDDFASNRNTNVNLSKRKNKFSQILNTLIPSISKNFVAKSNYKNMAKLLREQSTYPQVLVIGGRILGQGMGSFMEYFPFSVESDVSFGSRTMLICDAHDIPFENEAFEGVIVQAVLEHVVDPYRCVSEIHRVLKKHGLVYAETPFMQQVHGGKYDFTRFTYLGHRRLFREFEEVDSGIVAGPGTALAWSYQHFLLSFAKNRKFRIVINVFARLTSFFLKYFDYYLINKSGALDAASAYYFIGRKEKHVLSDQELLKLYKGA